jgi:DNA-damage-inducible protein J
MTSASCWISGSRSISVAAEANSYDTWFCAQVQAALEDARSGTSQVQVMQAAQALIDAKRQVEPKS